MLGAEMRPHPDPLPEGEGMIPAFAERCSGSSEFPLPDQGEGKRRGVCSLSCKRRDARVRVLLRDETSLTRRHVVAYPFYDVLGRGAGCEDLLDADLLQLAGVLGRDDSAAEHCHIGGA